MSTAAAIGYDAAMRLAVEHADLVKGSTYPNPPVGAVILDRDGRILGAIDRGSGDEAVDTGLGSLLDGVGVDAAVDLDQDCQLAGVDHFAYRPHFAQHLGNELLAAETGLY